MKIGSKSFQLDILHLSFLPDVGATTFVQTTFVPIEGDRFIVIFKHSAF
jgi:hypothetical protein